jgi:hypothetical protein
VDARTKSGQSVLQIRTAELWADTGTSTGRLMIAVLRGLADVERNAASPAAITSVRRRFRG